MSLLTTLPFISFLFLLSGSGLGVTDNFNRADTAASFDLSQSIGSGWINGNGTNADARISGGKVDVTAVRGTLIAKFMMIHTEAKTVNDGGCFTLSAQLQLDNTNSTTFSGIVFNYKDAFNYYLFRYGGNGTVQLLRVVDGAGLAPLSVAGGITNIQNRPYELTVSSSVPYTFNLSIRDTVTDTLVFSRFQTADPVKVLKNGLGGVYTSLALGAGVIDNFRFSPDMETNNAPVIFKDISYYPDSNPPEKMDIYLPEKKGNEPAACVLYLHGGGWLGGIKDDPNAVGQIFLPLVNAGFVVAAISYGMDQLPRWPQNLYDCKTAVRFLKKNSQKYGIDPQRIVVLGTSAGGHLALMTGLTGGQPELDPPAPYSEYSTAVAVGVDFFGITDVRRVMLSNTQGKRWGSILFEGGPDAIPADGNPAPEFPAAWTNASPLFHVTAQSVPFLLIHGTSDTTVEMDHSEQLFSEMQAAGLSNSFIRVEGAEHGITLITPDIMGKAINFLHDTLH